MGFLTSSNGTITGNGSAISRTGKLRVWVLTQTQLVGCTTNYQREQLRQAAAGNESKRTMAGDGLQKGAAARNKSVHACMTVGDDESSRQQMTKLTEDNKV